VNSDNLKETQRRLQTIMEGTEYAERIPPIFARLNVLMTYLQCFGVKRKVYINPLSSLHDKFYRGSVLFQCIFDSKRRDVFAAGGRYDGLIQEFSPKVLSNRPQAHAVGFNLSSDRLGSSMMEYLSSRAAPKDTETGAELCWTTRRVSDASMPFCSYLITY
jgi:translation initiation factor 2-alpha kinase 4